MKETHGGFYTIADIGRDELIKDMGVSNKRIPNWLLPSQHQALTPWTEIGSAQTSY